MHSLPIFLKLDGRTTLVVGGGEAAAQKVRLLRRAGAVVTVVARLIVEPYLIDVVEDDKAIWSVRYREVVCASGPSTHPAFGMQACRAAADRPAAA